MLRPSIKNIFLYILLKYLFFYVMMMGRFNDNSYPHPGGLKNVQDLFLQLWMFLPILNMIVFTAPIYFSFRLSGICILVAIMAISVAEYFMYQLFTSETHINMNGIYNVAISVAALFFFFYKYILKRVINP